MRAHGTLIQQIPYKALVAFAALGLSAEMAFAACAPLPMLWPKLVPVGDRLGSAGSLLTKAIESMPRDEGDIPRAIMVAYEAHSVFDALTHLATLILLHTQMRSDADRDTITGLFEHSLPEEIKQFNERVGIVNGYIAQMQNEALTEKSFDARDAMIKAADLLEKHCSR